MPTKDEIIERMFDLIPDMYDKSEGSIMYDSVVMVAQALEDGYIEQEIILDKAFATTAYDEYLDKKVADFGLERKPAIKATTTLKITGLEGLIIPVGLRFYADDVYFVSTESVTINAGAVFVPVECEQAGTLGNVPVNSIVNFEPTETISADFIYSITNESVVIDGVDQENDEQLRERFFETVRNPATSGNAQDYINWCKEVVGVGGAKVFPTWNGNGTVKCVIIDSNKEAASAELIETVRQNVEKNRPINGGVLTVESATEVPINISVDIDVSTGYEITTIQQSIANNLVEYLKEISFVSDYVSFAIIGARILNVEGVSDYRNLTVNGGTINIPLIETEVPVAGEINVL